MLFFEVMVPEHKNLFLRVKVKSLSRVRLFATPWTIAYQAPLSMGFSRQECWSGLPFPSPYVTDYYLAVKSNEVLIHATR